MTMRCVFLALFVFRLADFAEASGFGFLKDQSMCSLTCMNSGVCAYSLDNPSVHRCICFVGLYYGDRCEYVLSTTTPSIAEYTTTTTSITTTVAIPTTTESRKEEDDYTAEWRDFNKDLLSRESAENLVKEDESAVEEEEEEEDINDIEPLNGEQEYRYGHAEVDGEGDFAEYYEHPKQTASPHVERMSLELDEVTAATTTTERWALEFVESREYVNDDGSEEDGWMMMKRRKTQQSSAPSSFLSTVIVTIFAFRLLL